MKMLFYFLFQIGIICIQQNTSFFFNFASRNTIHVIFYYFYFEKILFVKNCIEKIF